MFESKMFGITNGIITMLALITGLYATKVPKVGIIGAILSLLIVDPLSDGYSIYAAEKKNNKKSAYKIGKEAFISQFILQLIFLIIIIFFPIEKGIFYSYLIGILIIIIYGIYRKSTIFSIIQHILCILILVLVTYGSDTLVYKYYHSKKPLLNSGYLPIFPAPAWVGWHRDN